MVDVPHWSIKGDWFDVCNCTIPCPCTFAQAPTRGDCEGVMAWHIRQGRYGDVGLDGLNIVAIGVFEGNVWQGAKMSMGMFMDERADKPQRQALATIFSGQAGGWPAFLAEVIGETRGVEYVPIAFEAADDLAYWRAEVPGRVKARGEALTGPTLLPGQRVQTVNPPGCEMGPNGVATWGTATENTADGFGLKFEWVGRSSKYIPFDWSGPDDT